MDATPTGKAQAAQPESIVKSILSPNSARRKRSAETDAERLEQKTKEIAKADADKRIALKRKAENDPCESEVEDSAMNSLAEL